MINLFKQLNVSFYLFKEQVRRKVDRKDNDNQTKPWFWEKGVLFNVLFAKEISSKTSP